MSDSVSLEQVVNLAKQLSPLDRIRLIEQITPQIKRDLFVSPSQPHKSLKGIWKGMDITEEELAQLAAEISGHSSQNI